jgi:hypothetical protein
VGATGRLDGDRWMVGGLGTAAASRFHRDQVWRYRDQNDVDRRKCTTFLNEVRSICQSLSSRDTGSVCKRREAAREGSAQNLARMECEIVDAYMRTPKQARSNGRFNARALKHLDKDPVTYCRPTYGHGQGSRAICAHGRKRHAMTD